MIIVRVKFIDWNAEERQVDVTSDMCENFHLCRTDIQLINTAYAYIERRYTEMIGLIGIEIIAN